MKQKAVNHGLHRWYSVAGLFDFFCFDNPTGKSVVGCQFIGVMNVETQTPLAIVGLQQEPAPFTAKSIIDTLEGVFKRNGKPDVGIIISPSIYASSEQASSDEATCGRMQHVIHAGAHWDEMTPGDRSTLQSFAQVHALQLQWGESPSP